MVLAFHSLIICLLYTFTNSNFGYIIVLYIKIFNLNPFQIIRNLREDNDKTQQEIADYLNIKQTTYSKYELGKINIPIEVFIKLADYYNVSLDYLTGRSKNKK